MNPLLYNKIVCTVFCCVVIFLPSKAQNNSDPVAVPGKIIERINKQAESYSKKIDRQTEKYLRKLERQEEKMRRKLARLDSSAAAQIFGNAREQYAGINQQIQQVKNGVAHNRVTQYLPGLDSMVTGLQFLQQNPVNNISGKTGKALQQYRELQGKLETSARINQFVKERKARFKEIAAQYNLGKWLKKYNKTAYYYSAQINEYRNVFKDPARAEQLVLLALNKIPRFKEYFNQFSQIGRLFPPPQNNPANGAAYAGLQTRAQVTQIITANAGGNITAVRQNMQQAQSMLNELKTKLNSYGGNGDADMPHFKPNTQKTKSLLNRLEWNANLQTGRGTGVLPNMADVAAGIGYKLSDKKIIGFQVAYKMGLGNGLNNIRLTTEGISYRSYLDMRFKGSFWLSGGYELSRFANTPQQQKKLYGKRTFRRKQKI